jgi:hypothetical protein
METALSKEIYGIDSDEAEEESQRNQVQQEQKSKKIQKTKHLENKKILRSFWTHLKPLLCNNPLIRYSEVLKKFLDLCQGGSRFSLRKFNTLMDYFVKTQGVPGLIKIQFFCAEIIRVLPIISCGAAQFETHVNYLLNFCTPVIQAPIQIALAQNQNLIFQTVKLGISHQEDITSEGSRKEQQIKKEELT